MKKDIPSEISDLVQFVLPFLASQYGYPQPEDQELVKIQQIPVRMGSTIHHPDVVYYWDGVPVLLIEAKKQGKTEKNAQDEALSYVRNFPIEKYSKNGVYPKFIATTVGKEINFYAFYRQISKGKYKDWPEKLESILSFSELLSKYGLIPEYKPVTLNPKEFRYEFLYELMVIYDLRKDRLITRDIMKNVALQILSYLENPKNYNYTSYKPYISLHKHRDRQERIRRLFDQYNIIGSLCPGNANEFRDFVLRTFQGGEFSQYMTEQCVIDFMVDMAEPKQNWKVLDFECGSGGFLASVIEKGKIPLENIKGIDIDELPYIIAKTYLAIYFGKHRKEKVDKIPIKNANGLFDYGNDWDLVISNPAGSNKYLHKDLKKVLKNLESDLNLDGRAESFSEYNFSVQQAVKSAKVGGKICLILPEGLFANSQDDTLRKYVAKHCRVLAIISLPRGVFKKGRETVRTRKATQVASMKMSILYAQKIKKVVAGEGVDLEEVDLNYPVFIANVIPPKGGTTEISKWLKPELSVVLKQWKHWEKGI